MAAVTEGGQVESWFMNGGFGDFLTPRAEPTRTFRIRPVTMADSPTIRQIRNAAIRKSLAIWTSIEQDPAQVEAWLAPMVQRGTALVAHRDDEPREIVGFAVASAWHSYEDYARTVEGSIYLSPQLLRGTALVPGFWPH
mgnify:CR=1 FL=1